MSKALVLIDFQEEWRNETSDYYLGDFKERVANAKRVLDFFRSRKLPIVFTRHIEIGSTSAFAEGSKNAEVIRELSPTKNETVIVKHKISPFYETNLEQILRKAKVDEIIVCGIMTNLCVRSAISDAYDRDFKITVIKDACVSDSNKTDEFTFDDLTVLECCNSLTEDEIAWIARTETDRINALGYDYLRFDIHANSNKVCGFLLQTKVYLFWKNLNVSGYSF
jgi:nicotinamidase-related amidase